jgi:hypothetical protein
MTGTQTDCRVCAERRPGALPAWFTGSHCRHCHSSWRGTAAAHALCCHRTFSSNAAVDLHQVNGRCKDPATLLVGPDGEKRLAFKAVERADGNIYWTPADEPVPGFLQRGQIAVNYASNGVPGAVGAEDAA